MKIARLSAPQQFEILDEPVPAIGPDEVLVKVAACGVCTSEVDMWTGEAGPGALPRYPGHEVSGVVAEVGAGVSWPKPGDPVAVWAPGRGFAEYIAVRPSDCQPVADLPLEYALAEPLACAVNAVELAGPALGDDIVLIGAGFMGNLCQLLLTLKGPRHLIVADVRDDALERARKLGATHVVNVKQESLPERVKALTDGRAADVSFEITGVQAGLDLLGQVTRMSGKTVIVGYHQGAPRHLNLGYWNWMAFNIINAHFRDPAVIQRGMVTGMRLLNAGRIRLDGLISHRFGLEAINDAFRTAHEKPAGFIKSTVMLEAA